MPAKTELDVLLAKLQSAIATAQTALTTTDKCWVNSGFEVTPTITATPVNNATGAMGQEGPVIGDAMMDIKASFFIVPTGSTTPPIISDWLISSGMTLATATNKHTYTPTSCETGWSALTLWKYSGDCVTGDSMLYKAANSMFDWELNLELGKPAEIIFTGKGIMYGVPAAASYPAITAVPGTSYGVAVVKATTATVNGVSVKLTKLNVKAGNAVTMLKDPTADYGYSNATIVDRKATFTATYLEDDNSTVSPWANYLAGTPTTLSFIFGIAGSRLKIASAASKTQISKVTVTSEDGINMYVVEGVFIDNNYTFVVNED